MNAIQWVFNRKKFESIKQLSFHNIINYICSMWNAAFPPKHIREQAIWRMEQIKLKSPECFNKKECFCGCDINFTVFQPDSCEEKNKCFPELMSKKEWDEFKEKQNIFLGWTEKSNEQRKKQIENSIKTVYNFLKNNFIDIESSIAIHELIRETNQNLKLTYKEVNDLNKRYWKSLSEKKKRKFSMTKEEWGNLKNSIK